MLNNMFLVVLQLLLFLTLFRKCYAHNIRVKSSEFTRKSQNLAIFAYSGISTLLKASGDLIDRVIFTLSQLLP